MAKRRRVEPRERWLVLSRIAAAVIGGYAFANIAGIFLSHVLPMSRADAVLAMTLASFAIYTAAVIWVFAARSASRAWLGLLVPSVILGGVSLLLGGGA